MSDGLNRGLIRAVLFDIDGTLADTHQVLANRLSQALQPISPLFGRRDLRPAIRRLLLATETPANSLYALADRLGLDQLAGPVFDLVHRVRGEARRQDYRIIPGARAALDRLRRSYRLGIVTARDARSTNAFLDRFDLAEHFDCLITARSCWRTKPHPAPVLRAAEQLGLPAHACLMVGDTLVDIRAAKSAGAQAIGVLCGFGERDELVRAGADLILETTADLAAALLADHPASGG